MNDPLVVLTYPGHFLLTGVTIKSFFKYNAVRPVVVLVDNLNENTWDGYFRDCIHFYSSLDVDVSIMPIGTLPEAHKFRKNNWVRQQIVKLYLDKLVDFKSWLFTDGDIEYCCSVPNDRVPFSVISAGSERPANLYVAKVLNIQNPGIITKYPTWPGLPNPITDEYIQACVSMPPWRWMDRDTLVQLRRYIESVHNMPTDAVHLKYVNMSISEWELIANFEQHVLGRTINLIYYPAESFDRVIQTRDVNYCKTCYCTDSGLTREWFETQGIDVSDRIWQLASTINGKIFSNNLLNKC